MNPNLIESFQFVQPTKVVYGPGCLNDLTT